MTENSAGWFRTSIILKGLVVAVGVSILLVLLMSLLFYFTSLSEKHMSLTSLAILFFSILIGGFVTSKSIGTKGLILGVVVAVVFLVFNIIVSVVFGSLGNDLTSLLIKSGTIILGGAMGGVIGVGFTDQ